MNDSVAVGKLMGLPVRIHWSVVVIVWLFAWSLAGTLPVTAPGYPRWLYWVAGGCGAACLAGALLAHELAHAVVARRAGIPVSGVTLWLFGGVARLAGEARTPGVEFRMAAAGPALSLSLAAVFGAVAAALDASGWSPLATAVVTWLAVVNAILAVFNLLPGAPLDGGRILRAYLWHRHGDPVRAAISAARAGSVVAYVLIAWGLFELFAGSVIGGAWMAFIGWFLLTAAHAERVAIETRETLGGISAADVMTRPLHTAPGFISVERFIHDYLLADRHSAYPVTGDDGSITGLVTLAHVRAVPAGQRATTPLSQAATPLDRVPKADAAEPITTVMERLDRHTGGRVLVTDAGRVVGIITPSDVARLIDVRRLAATGDPHRP
ncbi:site-2 protease family protein [Mycolicibacterium chubuense]|uniref:site-2 protease family protein n=1 Tax=Mycolicibacterium chubuense TaxID=1800 RepID=UPI0003171AFC|nr:site-2 protease family protein [Mycolicibacterium chubuense]